MGMTQSHSMNDAREQAGRATEQAKDKVRGGLRDQVGQRSQQAGSQLASTAADVRAVGEQLRERENDGAARLADQAADRTQQVADYLTNSDPDRILRDAEDLAHRQPWAVALGAAAIGFAASRMLKASSRRRAADRVQTDSWTDAAGPTGAPVSGPDDSWDDRRPTSWNGEFETAPERL